MSVRFIDFPPEMVGFRVIANKAFEEWAPGSEVSFRRLKQGYSGSAVVRADVRPARGGAAVESGEYIVKLSEPPKWADQQSEDLCHLRAEQFDVDFALQHIPRLLKIKHVPEITPDDRSAFVHEIDVPNRPTHAASPYVPGFAALYEIAGGSLARFAPLDRLDVDYFSNVAELISADLASHWAYRNPTRQLTVASSMRVPRSTSPYLPITTSGVVPPLLIRTAQYLNSGILPKGSSAELVSLLIAAS